MKICFLCDLHLPFWKGALQYRVLDWAVEQIRAQKPQCVVCVGDVTCDGNMEVYTYFLERMRELEIPFLYIPGNSDLRSEQNRGQIERMASDCRNVIDSVEIYMINDCTGEISELQYACLEKAAVQSIVVMHHPIECLETPHRERMERWRQKHSETLVVSGHMHISGVQKQKISLQALDPDKAQGECPCLNYYDTDSRKVEKVYFACPIPEDFREMVGISCYRPENDIPFAIAEKIQNMELRPNVGAYDREKLKRMLTEWRKQGGENLSVHLPDLFYEDGRVYSEESLDVLLGLTKELGIDRFTLHVPHVPVGVVEKEDMVLEKIAAFFAEKVNRIERNIVVGVENMHMNVAEKADHTRRFGYLPEECLAFMEILRKYCRHRIGINFDIGHARNNLPYSQKYQISTWLSMVGKELVGCHLHQVTLENGQYNNHMPITEVYGSLISYASFFKYWEEGEIRKVPLVFEMRSKQAYPVTLEAFGIHKP